jgi:hypothetical protein
VLITAHVLLLAIGDGISCKKADLVSKANDFSGDKYY